MDAESIARPFLIIGKLSEAFALAMVRVNIELKDNINRMRIETTHTNKQTSFRRRYT